MVAVHDFHPSTLERKKGGFLWIWGQQGLQSEFQDNQDCNTKKTWLTKKHWPEMININIRISYLS